VEEEAAAARAAALSSHIGTKHLGSKMVEPGSHEERSGGGKGGPSSGQARVIRGFGTRSRFDDGEGSGADGGGRRSIPSDEAASPDGLGSEGGMGDTNPAAPYPGTSPAPLRLQPGLQPTAHARSQDRSITDASGRPPRINMPEDVASRA